MAWDLCDGGEIITDGAGLIDVRNGLLDPENSKCPSALEVCCRLPEFLGEPIVGPPKPEPEVRTFNS